MRAPGPPDRQIPRRRVADPGEVEVFVANEQDDHLVDLNRYRDLCGHVLAGEGVRGEAELALVFIDEATMTELNQHHMGGQGTSIGRVVEIEHRCLPH